MQCIFTHRMNREWEKKRKKEDRAVEWSWERRRGQEAKSTAPVASDTKNDKKYSNAVCLLKVYYVYVSALLFAPAHCHASQKQPNVAMYHSNNINLRMVNFGEHRGWNWCSSRNKSKRKKKLCLNPLVCSPEETYLTNFRCFFLSLSLSLFACLPACNYVPSIISFPIAVLTMPMAHFFLSLIPYVCVCVHNNNNDHRV